MKYTFAKLNSNSPEHREAVGIISAWSGKSETMKTYRPEDIMSHRLGILAFCEDDILAGYIAVVEVEETKPKTARIGAFAVAQELQGNGVGSALIGEITKVLPEEMPEIGLAYAYVHEVSQKRFVDNGFSIDGYRQPPSPTGCNTIVSRQIQ